ncbi:hypothetical protein DCC39_14870 [Pueribacillus theae]|uniref:Uncharacterized protein n=1 Tax=Pueribacillus theae TaxID=2171751 RepID=A0A2U1JTZ5_9BACI|nr:hypothetical protein DCC39_14870 [Pueribacillus theae]
MLMNWNQCYKLSKRAPKFLFGFRWAFLKFYLGSGSQWKAMKVYDKNGEKVFGKYVETSAIANISK